MDGLLRIDTGLCSEPGRGQSIFPNVLVQGHEGHGKHSGYLKSRTSIPTAAIEFGNASSMRYRTKLEQLIKESAYETDVEIARLAGTTKQQIQSLKSGRVRISVEWAKRLAPLFKVKWPDLVDDDPADAVETEVDQIALAIGGRVQWCRNYRGLSIAEAAFRFAIPTERLEQIESGKVEMTIREVITIATKLQATTDFILRGQRETLPFAMAEDFQEAEGLKSKRPRRMG